MNAHAFSSNEAGMLGHALDYARRGWPVFPCHPATKQPLTKNGFKDASRDPDTIERWWQQHPSAMIGARMGRAAGVFALDPDVPKRDGDADGFATWLDLVDRHGGVPHTHTHETPSGGRHVLFRWRDDRPVTNREGALKGSGINVRGEGGYLIIPPSRTGDGREYRIAESLDWFNFADAPDWVLDLIEAKPEPTPHEPGPKISEDAAPRSGGEHRSGHERYVEVALQGEVGRVAAAGGGTRNNTLNEAAFRLGTLVGAGVLDAATARDALISTAERCGLIKDDGQRAVLATIESGLTAGAQHPREMPDSHSQSTWERGRSHFGEHTEKASPGSEEFGSDREHREAPGAIIRATPYVWTDPATVPCRQFLYGRHLIRSYVSATVAPGGVGKTALKIVEALAMVSGRDLLKAGWTHAPLRVWLWNLEDPRDELVRRIQAAAKHYGLSSEDLDGLFIDTGREQECVIAETTRSGAVIRRPVVDNIVAEITGNEIDVLGLDPFVSSHRVTENDNNAIDLVVKEWGRVAGAANCAIELVHHTRKQMAGEAEVTAESSRGAKALTDGCRSLVAVNRMSKEEGDKAGVENHRLYFRTFNDKNNLAPPPDASDWFRLVSVDLGNGHLGAGDNVGVVERWTWPDPLGDVTVANLRAVQDRVAAGQWRENVQAKNWVGNAVAAVLNLDPTNKAHRAKVGAMLKTWIASGMFVIVTGKDEKRNDRSFVEVGEWAND